MEFQIGPTVRGAQAVKTRFVAIAMAVTISLLPCSAAAYTVYGAIGDKWRQLGAENGPLGAPKSDEQDAPHGGRVSYFAYGAIYWQPSAGAHAVYGLINEKLNQLGGVAAFGYRLTDEQPATGGGRHNDFENGGYIYFHHSFGAHAVYGAIAAKWKGLGAESGPLGYPASDERDAANLGRAASFAFGLIYWNPTTGAHAVYGEIGRKWAELGFERGSCGYPTSDEADFDDGRDGTTYGYGVGPRFRRSGFEKGQILWSKARQVVYVECAASQVGPPPRPTGEACSFTAIASNRQCRNIDGSPSTLSSGGTTAMGCGGNTSRAQDRAKISLAQQLCFSDGDSPAPGCCTYDVSITEGCGCR